MICTEETVGMIFEKYAAVKLLSDVFAAAYCTLLPSFICLARTVDAALLNGTLFKKFTFILPEFTRQPPRSSLVDAHETRVWKFSAPYVLIENSSKLIENFRSLSNIFL